jgi:2-haloacid dehalogenase
MKSKIPALLFFVLLWSCSATATQPIKAIVFDGFVIFDPRPLVAQAEQLFPGHGAALCDAWRTRQFEYTWIRSMSGRYVDFWKITEDALIFAAKTQNIELMPESKKQLMDGYLKLKAWPDVLSALQALKQAGIRLAFLTNFTPEMIESNTINAGLNGLFEKNLSTDLIKTYKPDPRAYQMAIDAFGFHKNEILFAAFAGWDAAGAKSFGYETFWVNRMRLPVEELELPDSQGESLNELVSFVFEKH